MCDDDVDGNKNVAVEIIKKKQQKEHFHRILFYKSVSLQSVGRQGNVSCSFFSPFLFSFSFLSCSLVHYMFMFLFFCVLVSFLLTHRSFTLAFHLRCIIHTYFSFSLFFLLLVTSPFVDVFSTNVFFFLIFSFWLCVVCLLFMLLLWLMQVFSMCMCT